MIHITPTISLDERELQEEFISSSGPGGQNVNKTTTAVQIRFHVKKSPSLPNDVRNRLIRLAGNRISKDGLLIIEARRFRTQGQNRKDAVNRLVALIRKAAEKPKPRHKTSPPLARKAARLDEKRRRSKIKRTRQPVSTNDE